MTTLITIHPDDIGTLITPPEDAGQMIEVSYADAEDGMVRRTHDRADGTTEWHFAAWELIEGDYEPQNRRPVASSWTPCVVRP